MAWEGRGERKQGFIAKRFMSQILLEILNEGDRERGQGSFMIFNPFCQDLLRITMD